MSKIKYAELSDAIISFGKYNERKLIEIVFEDEGYCYWVIETFNPGRWKDLFGAALDFKSTCEVMEEDYPEGHWGGW